ncbi:MAG: hypothetical protein Q9202_003803 [Teloschistes flavicans]
MVSTSSPALQYLKSPDSTPPALNEATSHNTPLDQVFQSYGMSLSHFPTSQNITRVFSVQVVLALPIIGETVRQNTSSPALQCLATLWTEATQLIPFLSLFLYPSIPTTQQTLTLISLTPQSADRDPMQILADTLDNIIDPLTNVSSFLDFTRSGRLSDPANERIALPN